MRTMILILAILMMAAVCSAEVYVRGHYRSDGTYVNPYYRSNPDANPNNNYERVWPDRNLR
jgi:hypothetical protein